MSKYVLLTNHPETSSDFFICDQKKELKEKLENLEEGTSFQIFDGHLLNNLQLLNLMDEFYKEEPDHE